MVPSQIPYHVFTSLEFFVFVYMGHSLIYYFMTLTLNRLIRLAHYSSLLCRLNMEILKNIATE